MDKKLDNLDNCVIQSPAGAYMELTTTVLISLGESANQTVRCLAHTLGAMVNADTKITTAQENILRYMLGEAATNGIGKQSYSQFSLPIATWLNTCHE
jgi:hypothetical protein